MSLLSIPAGIQHAWMTSVYRKGSVVLKTQILSIIFETYVTNKQMHMARRIHVSHSNKEFMVVLLSTNRYFLKFEPVTTPSFVCAINGQTAPPRGYHDCYPCAFPPHFAPTGIRYPCFSTNLFFLCL